MSTLSDLLISYKQVEAPKISIYEQPEELPITRFKKMMENMQSLRAKKNKENTESKVENNTTTENQEDDNFGFVGWNYDGLNRISSNKGSNTSKSVTTPTQPTTTLTGSKSLNDNAKYAYNYFVKNGISNAAAAGIVGNLWHEGLANPSKSNPDAKGTTSLGIAQFNSRGELPALQKWAKSKNLKETDFDTQLGYLTEVVKSGRVDLSDPNITPEQASFIFGRDFERFAGDNGKGYKNYEDSHHKRRRQTAINLYNQYKS